jgi:hypothetical protein
MNRPYGAVDVAANLKGAVPKAAAQRILGALAERGDLVQKTYGACASLRTPMLRSRLRYRGPALLHCALACQPASEGSSGL